jgi:hypothetical protein
VSGLSDQQETLAALLPRHPVRIPRSFVGEDRSGRGPLAEFVRRHRGRALDLYLLALASRNEAEVPPLSAAVWGRALGLEAGSAAPIVSRLWRWLEGEGLLVSARVGRTKEIRLTSIERSERDILLASAFFHGNFHNRLPMPAKAVLLVALAETGWLSISDDGSDVYGLNRDTVRRGLNALRTIGLLRAELTRAPSPLTSKGFIVQRTYRVLPPFAPAASTEENRPQTLDAFERPD